ncbi:MAG TPA: hypothetical protein VHY35_10600 [Stellaceae bacterium]|jgi:hypothetical protein|nr:hypothetical protein [Stellaceae bacterium]
MPQGQLSDADIKRLFSALSAEVREQNPIGQASQMFRAVGFSNTAASHWAPLMGSIDHQFAAYEEEDKLRTIRMLAERLMRQTYPTDAPDRIKAVLADHGFEFFNGHFFRIGLFDQRELKFLPPAAAGEISTAMDRLVAGDLDGAISAAAGTVETVIASLTAVSAGDSFQQKAKQGIDAAGKLAALPGQLTALGWEEGRATMLAQNVQRMLNHAAYVMQDVTLRHGRRSRRQAGA